MQEAVGLTALTPPVLAAVAVLDYLALEAAQQIMSQERLVQITERREAMPEALASQAHPSKVAVVGVGALLVLRLALLQALLRLARVAAVVAVVAHQAMSHLAEALVAHLVMYLEALVERLMERPVRAEL